MKRFLLFILLYLPAILLVKAQEVDKASVRCLYKFIYTANKKNLTKKGSDELLLLIGTKYTYFYSTWNHTIDSLRSANSAEFIPESVSSGEYTTVSPSSKAMNRRLLSSEIYLIDRGTNDFKCMDKVGQDNFLYSEVLKNPIWKTGADTCHVLGYVCRKATTRYGGRDWTAWYTQEIAVSEGPWKLRGLPGLILKAETSDGEFSYTAVGLDRLADKAAIVVNTKSYKAIAKNAFFDIKKRFFYNPFRYVAGTASFTLISPSSSGRVLGDNEKLMEYNPVEILP